MKPTLIIVDDVKEIRERLFALLVEDFEILGEASNGKEAIQAVRTHQPQLVVMDVVMPEMSGIDATKVICSEFQSPPKVIILSGLKEENVVLQALEAGACEYLFKPVQGDKLKEVLWEMLRTE